LAQLFLRLDQPQKPSMGSVLKSSSRVEGASH
jgi:hypothetical protein